MAEIDAMFPDDDSEELDVDVLDLEEALDELKDEFQQMNIQVEETKTKKKKK